MKNKLLFAVYICLFCVISGCDIRSAYIKEGGGPEEVSSKPTVGAKMDVRAHYTNNCGKDVLVYYFEIPPNSSIPCGSLKDLGILKQGKEITVLVHKANVGFIVFADNPEGKCTLSRRLDGGGWIDGSQATAADAYFSACN